MSEMIQWCETPSPSAKRPSHTAWMESACWANTMGCRGWRGTMAVPTSIRVVAAPSERGSRHHVELVGDLGRPDRVQAGLVGPPGIGLQLLHLGGVAAPVRTHLETDPHPEGSFPRAGNDGSARQPPGGYDASHCCQGIPAARGMPGRPQAGEANGVPWAGSRSCTGGGSGMGEAICRHLPRTATRSPSSTSTATRPRRVAEDSRPPVPRLAVGGRRQRPRCGGSRAGRGTQDASGRSRSW